MTGRRITALIVCVISYAATIGFGGIWLADVSAGQPPNRENTGHAETRYLPDMVNVPPRPLANLLGVGR